MSPTCWSETPTREHRFDPFLKSMGSPCFGSRIANSETRRPLPRDKHSRHCVHSRTETFEIRIPRRRSIGLPIQPTAPEAGNFIHCGTGAFCLISFRFRNDEHLGEVTRAPHLHLAISALENEPAGIWSATDDLCDILHATHDGFSEVNCRESVSVERSVRHGWDLHD